jgi:N-acetylmuramoyl-L-alanine amidase
MNRGQVAVSKIYVSAGHGGSDPGAASGKRLEKTYNLEIALEVAELLRAAGHTVIMNRTDDRDSLINDKCKAANAAKVDLFAEIHLNAGGGTGCEVYHSKVGGTGKRVAEEICRCIALLDYRNRGPKTRLNDRGEDYFGIIRQTTMPAVLVECCFLDNGDDMARLERYGVDKMAAAVAAGILTVFPAVTKPAPAPAKPKNPYAEPAATQKKGSKGTGVKWAQWELKQAGYNIGTTGTGKDGIDGDFGSKTDAAVRAFQKKYGLVVDGKVGPKTRAKLKEV